MTEGNIIAIILTILFVLVLICLTLLSKIPDEEFLPFLGGAMKGNLKFESNNLRIMDKPTRETHVVNKKYVDVSIEDTFNQVENNIEDILKDVSFEKFVSLTGDTMKGDLTTDRAINIPSPRVPTHIVNKGYLEGQNLDRSILDKLKGKNMDEFLPLTGGTLTGNLNALKIMVNNPITDFSLTNKGYMDKAINDLKTTITINKPTMPQVTFEGKYLPLTGGTMEGDVTAPNIYLPSPPSLAVNLTNKKYVDELVSNFKQIQENNVNILKNNINDKIAKDLGTFLHIKGGTMKGNIKVPSITVVDEPLMPTSLANKAYADTESTLSKVYIDSSTKKTFTETELEGKVKEQEDLYDAYLPLTGGTVTGSIKAPQMTINELPSAALNVTNKNYVDKTLDYNSYIDEAIKQVKDESLLEFLPLSGGTMKGSFTAPEIKLADSPTNKLDAVNKAYLSNLKYYPLTGGVLNGDLIMGKNALTLLDGPTKGTDLANKDYINKVLEFLPLAGGTMKGSFTTPSIVVKKDPDVPLDIVNKGYLVDTIKAPKALYMIHFSYWSYNMASIFFTPEVFVHYYDISVVPHITRVIRQLAFTSTKNSTVKIAIYGKFKAPETVLKIWNSSTIEFTWTLKGGEYFIAEAIIPEGPTYQIVWTPSGIGGADDTVNKLEAWITFMEL